MSNARSKTKRRKKQPDNDALMLERMGSAVIELQVKYRSSDLLTRMQLRPALEELLQDYAKYQLRLLKEGVISGDDDLKQMHELRSLIDRAADQQALALAVAKTIAFVATKV